MRGFQDWWSRIPSGLDPYIIEIGSFRVGWYGLMYVAAFLTAYLLASHRIRREGYEYSPGFVQDYLAWAALGLIAGARLGYVVFYNPGYYLANPLEIFLPFTLKGGFRFTGISGMSYHGGLVGAVIASILFLRRHGTGFWRFSDFFVPTIPLGYTFGRLGNFINGELYGRAASAPWGMYFPSDPSGLLRHPSQLYEALFEGIFLFALLWMLRKKSPFEGFLLSIYLMGYGVARFFIEFFREPDSHLGLITGPFSMGQLLSLAMIAGGGALMAIRARAAGPTS